MYKIFICDITPGASNGNLLMRVSNDAGSSWQTGSNYMYVIYGSYSTSGSSQTVDASDTSIKLTHSTGNSHHVDGDAVYEINIAKPSSTTSPKVFSWWGANMNNTQLTHYQGGGIFNGNTSAITGLQLFLSDSASLTGSFRLYGIAKS